jgi:polar amino acid transport system substrate-binding protein
LAPIAKSKGGKLEIAATDTANLNKLIRGRIDIFACSENVGRYLLQTQFKPEEAAIVEIHPRPIHTGSLHLIIPKTHPRGPALIRKFNEGLIMLQQSGHHDLFLRQSNRGEYLPVIYRLQQKQ